MLEIRSGRCRVVRQGMANSWHKRYFEILALASLNGSTFAMHHSSTKMHNHRKSEEYLTKFSEKLREQMQMTVSRQEKYLTI